MTKKILFLFTAMMLCIMLSAQTQQGYVKTKGRLANDGSVIAGTRIPNATIQVKDRTPVVSQDDGTFSFPIPANKFYLQNVQKQGYVLTDPEALSKQYTYSHNDLIIVMEDLAKQEADRRAIERKINSKLYAQLLQRGEELDALREQNKITEEKYCELLQKLNKDQDDNEKIIKDMAERYVKMDFDQIDEFKRKVSEYILNGELMKADSMLNSKGNLTERSEQLKRERSANAKEKEELDRRQTNLQQSEAYTQAKLEDLANDCYNKFEIFKMMHENDSAAYYMELRAGLDSTNVGWLLDAGLFAWKYISDFEKAMSYHQQALRHAHAKEKQDGHSNWTSLCLFRLGLLYEALGNFESSLDYLQQALVLQKSYYGDNNPYVAKTYNTIGTVYFNKGDFAKAIEYPNLAISTLVPNSKNGEIIGNSLNLIANVYMELDSCDLALNYYSKALEMSKMVHSESHSEVAHVYNNIAYVYNHKGDYYKALEYYTRAIEIKTTIFGENHPEVALCYDNIGTAYHHLDEINKAIISNKKSMEIRERILPKNHPDLGISYNNIGFLYSEQKDYENALEYYNKALSIFILSYGEDHPNTATLIENIGAMYVYLGDYSKGMELYNKAKNIRIKLFGESHSSLGRSYNNIAHAYSQQQDYQTAIECYNKALSVFQNALGDNHPSVAVVLTNIGKTYATMEDYSSALDYYEAAKKIKLSVFGDNHPKTLNAIELISEIQAKLKEQENQSNE